MYFYNLFGGRLLFCDLLRAVDNTTPNLFSIILRRVSLSVILRVFLFWVNGLFCCCLFFSCLSFSCLSFSCASICRFSSAAFFSLNSFSKISLLFCVISWSSITDKTTLSFSFNASMYPVFNRTIKLSRNILQLLENVLANFGFFGCLNASTKIVYPSIPSGNFFTYVC